MTYNLQPLTRQLCTINDQAALVQQLEAARERAAADKLKQALQAIPEPVLAVLQPSATQDATALSRALANVITQVKALPVVHLTLTYLPTIHQVQELSHQLREHLDRQLILSYQTDSSLLAGIRVEFTGRRVEYSLQQAVLELKEKNGAP